MSPLQENINQIKDLVDIIEEKITPFLGTTESLEKNKKDLQVLEWKIDAIEKEEGTTLNELKNQRIKLILKIEGMEQALFCARELSMLGSSLTKKYHDFRYKSYVQNSKIVDHFDGKSQTEFGAFKVQNMLKEKVKQSKINELASLINNVCKLTGNDSIYVLNKKLRSKNDLGFHEEFFKTIEQDIIPVLRFNQVNKTRFTLSDVLKYYVIYTLKRDKRYID